MKIAGSNEDHVETRVIYDSNRTCTLLDSSSPLLHPLSSPFLSLSTPKTSLSKSNHIKSVKQSKKKEERGAYLKSLIDTLNRITRTNQMHTCLDTKYLLHIRYNLQRRCRSGSSSAPCNVYEFGVEMAHSFDPVV